MINYDKMNNETTALDEEKIKTCNTMSYENEFVVRLLGEKFNPGGLDLTLLLGEKLALMENSYVLDVACGTGTSALELVKRFGCSMVGIGLSEKNLNKAKEKAKEAGLSDKLKFMKSDAENIDFENETFDAVICECALCNFQNIKTAINEIHRVLKPKGKLGLTDVTMENELPENLKNIFTQVGCLAGALPVADYQMILIDNGFSKVKFEDHSYAIQRLFERVTNFILGWELMEKNDDFNLPGDFGISRKDADDLIKTGYNELDKGNIGYGLFIGTK